MKKNNLSKVLMAIVIFTFISCSKNDNKAIIQPGQEKLATNELMSENGANPDESAITALNSTNSDLSKGNSEMAGENQKGHFLYSESNATGQNQILVYEIRPNGSLHFKGATASGGSGTGKGLGSQGALALDKNHEWLFAVNAGSNSVSSFKVHDDGSLTLAHTESSWGTGPNSVSISGNLLYVLNHGSDNIHGLWIGAGGMLTHIDGSTQSLSGTSTDAPQVSFNPNGDWIIVTEKATNNISSFKVKNNGSVWPGVVTASTGQTPFGFDFARDHFMIVSNAAGGAVGAGSATSYFTGNNVLLHAVNGAIDNHQAAPCWVAVTQYGRFAFITNTASNSISSYYVAPWGGLYLVHEVAASTDNTPIDIVVAKNNYYVYELNSEANTIGEYHRTFFGGLKNIGSVSALPASATGLATY
ncbi:MAG: beta-propeller fold lactonase family protein [Bacteroidota bacterium]|nr:beta-propeller fold lactonase family protein [Bacteroidota bacterium]